MHDLNKINSSTSPVRVSLGEKINNRRDRFRQSHNKIFNQIQNKSDKIASANNTFFVTKSSNNKSKIKLNRSNLDDNVSRSFRKLHKNIAGGSEIPIVRMLTNHNIAELRFSA